MSNTHEEKRCEANRGIVVENQAHQWPQRIPKERRPDATGIGKWRRHSSAFFSGMVTQKIQLNDAIGFVLPVFFERLSHESV